VLGCRDYARIDIRLRNGVFYVLDINANPDISRETSMAYAAEIAGYSYNAMIGNILSLAIKRHHLQRNPGKRKAKKRLKHGSYYECDLLNFE
jgi:D-alanine-D-alanine ligase